MEFLKKHYRGIVLSFLIGVLMPAAIGPTIKADVSSDNVFSGTDTVDEVIVQYHLIANAYTNIYLVILTDENYQDYSATSYVPASDCSNANVTTFCLAVLLDGLLVDFEEKLRDMENDYDVTTEEGASGSTINSAITQALSNREKIDIEIQAARDTLDLTLAVYNQVQTVYPIHKELADIIANMETYRDNLAAIRSQMELYPSKFNNATSATCK
jgi:hypothetical protein